MPSLRSLLSSAYVGTGAFLSQFPMFQSPQPSSTIAPYTPFTLAPSCPIDGPLSCHNTTSAGDTCCFVYPGGQLLQTQFWDSSPSVGPDNSWTIHGLWPDLCDGTYDAFCNAAPQYHNISSIIEAADPDLLNFMNDYWLPNEGTNEKFWEHEWNKHGTCISTLSPDCYGDGYEAGMEVVDFFQRTVALFKKLDTYTALKKAGIVPSTKRTYQRAQIQAALKTVNGVNVVVGCDHKGHLNEVWYSYNVKGSVQTGDFVPITPAGTKGASCPANNIKYLPK